MSSRQQYALCASQTLEVALDLSNLLAVMQDLLEALMSLSVEDRNALLLQKEMPEGEVEGLEGNSFDNSYSASSEEGSGSCTPTSAHGDSLEDFFPDSLLEDAITEEGLALDEEPALDEKGNPMMV